MSNPKSPPQLQAAGGCRGSILSRDGPLSSGTTANNSGRKVEKFDFLILKASSSPAKRDCWSSPKDHRQISPWATPKGPSRRGIFQPVTSISEICDFEAFFLSWASCLSLVVKETETSGTRLYPTVSLPALPDAKQMTSPKRW